MQSIARHSFEAQHLRAAAYFSRESYGLEQRFLAAPSKALVDELEYIHRAYVTASIFSCVASLEALINNLFESIVDSGLGKLGLGKDYTVSMFPVRNRLSVRNVREIWPELRDRESTLNKYRLALLVYDKEPFARGEPPLQGVETLISLRNLITHYKPEWVTIPSRAAPVPEYREYKRLEGALRHVANNPLAEFLHSGTSDHPSFFPEKLLCQACAEWGVQQAFDFMKAFVTRLELQGHFAFLYEWDEGHFATRQERRR